MVARGDMLHLPTAREGGLAKYMTLLQLSVEYRTNSKVLSDRIALLQQDMSQMRSWDDRCRMEARIHTLSTMQREAREIAVLLERYYERGYRRNVKYTI